MVHPPIKKTPFLIFQTMRLQNIRSKIAERLTDLKDGKYFISGKLAFFTKSLSSGAYLHFLNLFLKDVGLNTAELGFIAGLLYAGMFIVGPILGMIVDHTGRRRLFFTCLAVYLSLGVLAMAFVARATNSLQVAGGTH